MKLALRWWMALGLLNGCCWSLTLHLCCQKFEGVILWLLFPGIRGGNKGNSPRAETLQAPVRSAQAIWALALNYARVKKLRIA